MTLQPQSAAAIALCAAAVPDLPARLAVYRVVEDRPDPELFACFLDCLDQSVAAIAAAGPAGDLVAVARQAHAIKGMGGAAGAAEISVLGEALERAAKTGDVHALPGLVRVLMQWRAAVRNDDGAPA